jgi:hypothetical protein
VDDALAAFALLADDDRLRVAAAVLLGGGTTDDVAERAGVAKRKVLEALSRLEAGGLVRHEDKTWVFDVARLKEIARDARPREQPDDVGDVDAQTAAVLRTFLRGGRLTQIPMQHGKRRVVLDHICRVFEIGRRYPEREVNGMLRAFHPDHAALRRYLVEEGFLTREHNVYWRTGGSVDIEP